MEMTNELAIMNEHDADTSPKSWRDLNLSDDVVMDNVLRFYWTLYLIETYRQLLYAPSTFNSLLFPLIWTAVETILLFLGIQFLVRVTNSAYRVAGEGRHRFSVTTSAGALIVVWIVTDILIIGSMTIKDIVNADGVGRDLLFNIYHPILEQARSFLRGHDLDNLVDFNALAINTLYSLSAILLLKLMVSLNRATETTIKPSNAPRVCWPAVWIAFSLVSTAHATVMI